MGLSSDTGLAHHVLGINEGHLSTACLLTDGKIVSCISEERLVRKKGVGGFPTRAVEQVLGVAGISPVDLDLVVLGFRDLPLLPEFSGPADTMSRGSFLLSAHRLLRRPWYSVEYRLPALRQLVRFSSPFYEIAYDVFREERIRRISKHLGIAKERVIVADHHRCHALTAYLGSPFRDSDVLVLTSDGVGDGKSATVSVGRDGKLRTISVTSEDDSLAVVYLEVTRFLGMKPLNDEYKVMGLAGYCPDSQASVIVDQLRGLMSLDTAKGSVRSRHRPQMYQRYLKDHLSGRRFDHVAGGAQRLVEDLLVDWIRLWIRRTGISTICLAGGIFMNVKANMRIMQMPEVREMFVFPSGGDESIAIGSALYGYQKLNGSDSLKDLEPLSTIYFGPAFAKEDVERALADLHHPSKFRVERHANIDGVVSELLADRHMVGRVSGRMEWGARALGNRSILADASDPRVGTLLNRMIKQRDFWMPFAPAVLWHRKEDYMEWNDKTKAAYMSIGYQSKRQAETDLIAAMHPYDLTLRPQVLEEDWNPSFYRIIKRFEDLTGKGGILNTSFNLHGEPLVCSPIDALRTFESSGLEYLALGEFMIEKQIRS